MKIATFIPMVFSSVLLAGPGTLDSINVNPEASQGTVSLVAPAPPNGVRVRLKASGSALRVPSEVYVPANQQAATFRVDRRQGRSAFVTVTARVGREKVSSRVLLPPSAVPAVGSGDGSFAGGSSSPRGLVGPTVGRGGCTDPRGGLNPPPVFSPLGGIFR